MEHNGKRMGFNPRRNLWLSKLRCSCGKSYKRYHWRTNQNSIPVYGYACKNVVTNGSREYRKGFVEGNDLEGFCNVRSFPEWKLELMFQMICNRLIRNPTKTKERLVRLVYKFFEPTKSHSFENAESIGKDLQKIEKRLSNLMDMRLDGSITPDEYKNAKEEMEKERQNCTQKLEKIKQEKEMEKQSSDANTQMEEVEKAIGCLLDFEGETCDRDLVDALIVKVTPCPDYTFKWYLNLRNVDPERMSLCDSFHVTYDEASDYRKKNDSFLRRGQWNDLLVEVYA